MAMAALSCARSPLGLDRTTGLNDKNSRRPSSDRNEDNGGRFLEIVQQAASPGLSFSERNPKPCGAPLRLCGSSSAFTSVQAALKPEQAGSEAARVSSRVSYKSPRRGSLQFMTMVVQFVKPFLWSF